MHVKAQVVIQGISNKPEDRFVNTFHFQKAWSTLADAQATLAPALQAFYDVPAVSGDTIGKFLSRSISNTFRIKFYDMAQEEPRVPLESTFSRTALPNTTPSLPQEVAVCCSFTTVPPITPSRRGRIYLGPLHQDVVMGGDTTAVAAVSATFRNIVKAKCEALANGDYGWAIYSAKNGTLARVMRGFIDDSFDTQRRRGAESFVRTTWTSSWTGSF